MIPHNLTFKELKNELDKNKNNPVRAYIIRNLMFVKYNEHIKRKQIYLNQQQMMNQPIIFNDNDFNSVKSSSSEKSSESDNMVVHREIKEYDRDSANNHMIDRMNSDIQIRDMGQTYDNKYFQPPYSNVVGDNYVGFDSIGENTKSFSNPKISSKKK